MIRGSYGPLTNDSHRCCPNRLQTRDNLWVFERFTCRCWVPIWAFVRAVFPRTPDAFRYENTAFVITKRKRSLDAHWMFSTSRRCKRSTRLKNFYPRSKYERFEGEKCMYLISDIRRCTNIDRSFIFTFNPATAISITAVFFNHAFIFDPSTACSYCY